jgi:arsenate reductase
MSEALFVAMAQGRHEARSAGTSPTDHVHLNVVAIMREVGVELADRVPQLLSDDLAQWADVVVTMGCGDACPVIPGKRYLDWDLPDPKDLPPEQVRSIREDIAARVRALVESLDLESA